MPEQLIFDLPVRPSLDLGDFFVSPGNAAAVEAIQTWHDWPRGKLVLAGPRGSGKTHLAHVWAKMTGARIVAAGGLSAEAADAQAAGPLVVEDAPDVAGDAGRDAALVHLHNLMHALRHRLLLPPDAPPVRWGLALPDLASRMQGSALVSLAPPDDALLAAVLVKLFADRQVEVDPDLVSYLVRNMERSFEGAGRMVETLDATALAERRAITRRFAARVLDKLPGGGS